MREFPEHDFDDLAPIDFAFRFGGKSYVLKEPLAEDVLKWRGLVLRFLKPGPDGMMIPQEGIADTEMNLISACCYDKNSDGSIGDKPLPVALLRKWPSRIQKFLFSKCKELAQVDTEDSLEELEKQLSSLTKRVNDLREKENKLAEGADPKA